MKKAIRLGLVAAMSVMLMGVPGAAHARVIKNGSCTRASDWKLQLHFDDGRLDTEFEVDSNIRGQRWRVTLKDDGRTYFRGIRRTHGRSGSFTVERKSRNMPGRDNVFAKARNLRTGEVCRAGAGLGR